jgi:hypothetical protein
MGRFLIRRPTAWRKLAAVAGAPATTRSALKARYGTCATPSRVTRQVRTVPACAT